MKLRASYNEGVYIEQVYEIIPDMKLRASYNNI